MVKYTTYWYKDDEGITLSRDIPPTGVNYLERTVSPIGIPNLRTVSIRTSDGKLLYSDIENIPLKDDLIEQYLNRR